jgi:dipeptide/tripeptide permease
MLLACQAHFPSLHPPPCDIVNHPSECTAVSGRNLSLLTLGLYVIPIGEGAVRVCAAALGGDQFDGDDPRELRGKASFFNWYAFCISLGGFVGLVFVVWVQNNEGWDLGFVLSALVAVLGTLVLVAGLPFYRHQKPTGSPLTRILQVRTVHHIDVDYLSLESCQDFQFSTVLKVLALFSMENIVLFFSENIF